MRFQIVIDRITAMVNGRVSNTEGGKLPRHADGWRECAPSSSRLQASLRALPARSAPLELTARLRVVASKERARAIRRSSPGSMWLYWRDRARVWSDNLMKPVALPVAGGLLSALFLFAILAPMYGIQDRYLIQDVPTILSTQAALRSSTVSFGVIDQDIVVDVLVDGNGQMLDYSVPAGQVWQYNARLRRCVENTLLCTQFKPATIFGQPRPGTIRFTLRRNHVEVKG